MWWIGIGHAGTLISAILFLLRQNWRTSINRAAEAMTIFAVMCAGIFPLIHIGRIWFGWWLFPIPNSNSIWPQFRSPLMWDVFAVSTYFTVSVLFWYMGLIPDLAVMRDRAKTKIRKFGYGLFALGWTGSNRHWSNYEKAYLILAGLSTPLVLSVHSIVSLDFSVSQLPGWHTTIFPPYFVAGAVFSGFGMVLTLLVPLRRLLQAGGHHHGAARRVDVQSDAGDRLDCRLRLRDGVFHRLVQRQSRYERYDVHHRAARHTYWWAYWTMIICNVVVPQLFWFKKIRTRMIVVFILSILVNIGMWFERFVIVVISLHRDFLPSNWGYYRPDLGGHSARSWARSDCSSRFSCCSCASCPLIAIAEVKGVTPQADPHHPLGGAKNRRTPLMADNPQALRHHGGIREPGGHPARGGQGARRGIPQLGRFHAVPGPRHGPGHGHQEFQSGLVLLHRRRDRLHHAAC